MVDDPLSGWGLRPVELAHQAVLSPFFASLREPLSDYTFSQIYTWRNSLRILWKVLHGHLCVFANGCGDLTLLLPPIGDNGSDCALAEAFELMDEYNAARGIRDHSRVEYASDEMLARFDRSRLNVQPMGTDYVYDVNRMIDLAGGDLASKRQAKNRFMRNYEFRVQAYLPERHLFACRQLLDLWRMHQADPLEPGTIAIKRQRESLATELALEHARELNLDGMVVWVNDPDLGWSIRGFTLGEGLGHDQSSIVVEKTDLAVKGLAQFIFSEFCERRWRDRPLVNVGDDWGIESLTWTKMSYRPVKLMAKYALHRQPQTVVAVTAPTAGADEGGETIIRRARKEDLAAAVELERACFSTYSLTKRQMQYLHQRSSVEFLVAERGGEVVGEGIALVRQHKKGISGRIYSLAVNPHCRGRGIGQKLLAAMITALAERGARRIYLQVEQLNEDAIKLYGRSGFRSIGQLPNYYGPGKHGLHMMLEVPARQVLPEPAIVA
jgi:uncharacterized protein